MSPKTPHVCSTDLWQRCHDNSMGERTLFSTSGSLSGESEPQFRSPPLEGRLDSGLAAQELSKERGKSNLPVKEPGAHVGLTDPIPSFPRCTRPGWWWEKHQTSPDGRAIDRLLKTARVTTVTVTWDPVGPEKTKKAQRLSVDWGPKEKRQRGERAVKAEVSAGSS